MKTVVFRGEEYVRAADVAKQFKYTQDYVGQLCRSGKVKARLVGRSWYVLPASVTDYRATKHTTQKTSKAGGGKTKKQTVTDARVGDEHVVAINTDAKKRKPVAQVPPVLRPKTVRNTVTRSKVSQGIPVSFSPDDTALLPLTDRVAKPAPKIRVRKRPTKVITVRQQEKKQTSFVASELPEISLSGKVLLSEISEEISPSTSPDTVTENVTESIDAKVRDASSHQTAPQVSGEVRKRQPEMLHSSATDLSKEQKEPLEQGLHGQNSGQPLSTDDLIVPARRQKPVRRTRGVLRRLVPSLAVFLASTSGLVVGLLLVTIQTEQVVLGDSVGTRWFATFSVLEAWLAEL